MREQIKTRVGKGPVAPLGGPGSVLAPPWGPAGLGEELAFARAWEAGGPAALLPGLDPQAHQILSLGVVTQPWPTRLGQGDRGSWASG